MSSLLEHFDRTPVTYLVMLAYITMALVTHPVSPTRDQLIAFGACQGYLVQSGEAWRLLTHAFLHGGLLHLAFNSYFLLSLGPMLENTLGSVRFAAVYILGAVGGGLGGCLWHSATTPLVGGSGALFAMMGAALAWYARGGRHVLDFLGYLGPRQLLSMVILNLVLGYLLPIVSNAAHIGGLIAGSALVFCFLERGREPADGLSRVIQAGWLALLASLLFYAINPVVRLDYLADRLEEALEEEPDAAPELARAILAGTDDGATADLTRKQVDHVNENLQRAMRGR
ncbi:MAG: rhomboid family intramembrane serine protease [Planctomycetota bacterium]